MTKLTVAARINRAAKARQHRANTARSLAVRLELAQQLDTFPAGLIADLLKYLKGVSRAK